MNLLKDVRYAIRTLIARPAFLLVATGSMALGIGANTAIVSLIDAVLWTTLPVRDARSLVLLDYEMQQGVRMRMHSGWSTQTDHNTRVGTSFKYPSYLRFQERADLFRELFAFAPFERSNLNARGTSQLVNGQTVSGSYFGGLGLVPYLGRLIDAQDDRPEAVPVLVLHYDYWQSRFGGDPEIVGEAVSLNQSPFTVVGVAPPGFHGTLQIGARPGFSIPISSGFDLSLPFSIQLMDEGYWWVRIMGRLQEGVTRSTVSGFLSQIETANLTPPPQLAEDNRAPFPVQVRIQDGSRGLEELRGELGTPLLAISAVAGLLLLLCCANVAGLLVVRAGARKREMAVRLSLGATRWRLIRQLLVESILIAGTGGTAGLLLALGLRGLLASQFTAPGPDPLQLDLSLNGRVLAATALLALLTGLIFGLAPAIRGSSVNLVSGLKEGALSSTRSRSRLLLGRALVGGQVALSVVVLATAGLLLGTVENLRSVEVGFDPENLLVFRVDPRLSGYGHAEQLRLQHELRERLAAIPGVLSATSVDPAPVARGGMSINGLLVEGKEGMEFSSDLVNAAPNFFETLGLPILAGRGLLETDAEESPPVAVLAREAARTFFGEENPVGKRISFDADEGFNIEIVGVVEDIKNRSLRRPAEAVIYLPERQSGRLFSTSFVVRTGTEPAAIISAVRETVRAADPNLPIFDLKLFRDRIRQDFHSETQFARLTSLFALIGLLLACVGLYGILAQAVSQRTREFGIRIALGANRSKVAGLVMKEIYLVAGAVVAGIAAAWFATRTLESLLFGLSPHDPGVLAAAALAMLAAGSVAAYLPARKASATDPLQALRSE